MRRKSLNKMHVSQKTKEKMRMNLQDKKLKDLRRELKELAMELGLDNLNPTEEEEFMYLRENQDKRERFDQIFDEISAIVLGNA